MRNYPSSIGNRYGKLLVVEQLASSASGQRRWLCKCDCGGTHIATTGNLNRGRSTNCGCKKSPDLTGKVFGRLTVLNGSVNVIVVLRNIYLSEVSYQGLRKVAVVLREKIV
jgi:hypothetical protein